MDYTVDYNIILELLETIKTYKWWCSKEYLEAHDSSNETVNDMLTKNPDALKYIEKALEEKKEYPDDVKYNLDVFHPRFRYYISVLWGMERTLEWMIEYTKDPSSTLIIPMSFEASVGIRPWNAKA